MLIIPFYLKPVQTVILVALRIADRETGGRHSNIYHSFIYGGVLSQVNDTHTRTHAHTLIHTKKQTRIRHVYYRSHVPSRALFLGDSKVSWSAYKLANRTTYNRQVWLDWICVLFYLFAVYVGKISKIYVIID